MANPRSPGTESGAPLRVSGGVFTLSILHLESNNPQQLAQRIAEEHQRHPAAADFHRHAPVVLDLSAIPEEAPLALPEILEVLRAANCSLSVYAMLHPATKLWRKICTFPFYGARIVTPLRSRRRPRQRNMSQQVRVV